MEPIALQLSAGKVCMVFLDNAIMDGRASARTGPFTAAGRWAGGVPVGSPGVGWPMGWPDARRCPRAGRRFGGALFQRYGTRRPASRKTTRPIPARVAIPGWRSPRYSRAGAGRPTKGSGSPRENPGVSRRFRTIRLRSSPGIRSRTPRSRPRHITQEQLGQERRGRSRAPGVGTARERGRA